MPRLDLEHGGSRPEGSGVKQVVFLVVMIAGGTAYGLLHPLYGVMPYYVLAILKPQFLWDWALPDDMRWSLMAAAGAIFALVMNLPRVLSRFQWNMVATLLVVFMAMLLLSCLTARDPAIAAHWVQTQLKILLMAVVTMLLIEHVGHLRHLSWLIFATIAYLAWDFNSLYLFQGRLDILFRGHGGLDNNGAGLLIASGLPFAYLFVRTAKWWWLRLAAAGVGVLMVHAVMLSYSRGAMVACLAGVVWLLVHHRPRRQAIGGAIAGVIVVLALAGPEIRSEFLSIADYPDDPSAASRFDSWEAAWKIAWDHPIDGVGVRNSNLYSHAYGADVAGRTIHNQYLQIAADNGIPALCVYVLMCLMALWGLRRWHRRLTRIALAPAAAEGEVDDAVEDAAEGKAQDSEAARRMAALALALEAGLVVSMVGGVFLSLETFELTWLLLVMAGALPGRIKQALEAQPAAPRLSVRVPLLQGDVSTPQLASKPFVQGPPI